MNITRKIFTTISKQLGFTGKPPTFFVEHESYFLIINYQKSSHGSAFYINAGITYKELLAQEYKNADPTTAYSSAPSAFPIHVDFRAENIPQAPYTQSDFDKLSTSDDHKKIERCLHESIQALLKFSEKNHNRSTIRNLKETNKFSAIIMKSV